MSSVDLQKQNNKGKTGLDLNRTKKKPKWE